MPMSNPTARQGHVILRVVLTALSIAVLLACVLMWWMTVFEAQPVASTAGAQSQAVAAPPASGSE